MKKVIAAILTIAIAAGMFAVSAGAAGIFDNAKSMKDMQYYNITANRGEPKYYKIVLPKDGKITIRYASGENSMSGTLMNTKAEIIWSNWLSDNGGANEIKVLKAGTYYLRFQPYYSGDSQSRLNDFYYTFTPDDKPTLAIKISVKAKTEIQLGSVVSDYKGKVTWTSSSKSVATVNDKGLVKTLKKGTAVIKAELDDGTFDTIRITVT